MPTMISLTCSECNAQFQKTKTEVTRRRLKLPNSTHFFCTRSCGRSFNNRLRTYSVTTPQHGNQYGRRYSSEFGWYARRCGQDKRFGVQDREWRSAYDAVLSDQWTIQDGRCAVTGVYLQLRDSYGKVDTENRFLIASVDRINCDRPYEKGNIQWVSVAMNQARGNQSLDAFVADFRSTLLPPSESAATECARHCQDQHNDDDPRPQVAVQASSHNVDDSNDQQDEKQKTYNAHANSLC